MARFSGQVGYTLEQIETTPGVWEDVLTERNYSGEVLKSVYKTKEGENLNDDLTVNNRISIVADPFAFEKFHAMRYVKWTGTRWKILSVEVNRPRLILTIGGVYNGPTP